MNYDIIYADPPWQFKTYSAKGGGRSPERHYKCMTIEDIKTLPVGELASKNCVLFLWTVFPHLEHALAVVRAWGFTYKTVGFVWVKTHSVLDGLRFHWGMGYWSRSNAEVCLLATRGHPKRVNAGVHQVVAEPRREHSRKPDTVRNRIVKLMGDRPRIELFARQKTPGWDVWGDEVNSDIKMER